MDAAQETADKMLSQARTTDLASHIKDAERIVEITKGGSVTKITVEQLVAEGAIDLRIKIKTLENDLDLAHADNKRLHEEIEELTPVDDGKEATYAEAVTAVDVAETARKELECENKRLRHEIADLKAQVVEIQDTTDSVAVSGKQ
ncbi:hypothetical protein LCGC14_1581030 [marine sediment metagenome]|uniref:Uncharacterized protein n=1 Tax=marine sediment metagenome TaxID=412755 RepID=A0A0F9LH22_9ZZZZ